jgi:transcriptional regulator of acetoin/glycerol metabolism
MQINAAALQKLKDAPMTSKHIVMVAEAIGGVLEVTGASDTQMTLDYQHPEIKVKHGDLIPYLTIGLRQATVPQLTADEAQERADAADAKVEQEATIAELNKDLRERQMVAAKEEQEFQDGFTLDTEDTVRDEAEAAIKPVADTVGITDDERGAIVDHFNDMVNKSANEDTQ